jgi:hypothetical protein
MNAMKYFLPFLLTLGAIGIATPSYAQFTTFPSTSESCSNLCIKLDVGSANNSIDSFAFNNGSSINNTNGIRWQISVNWRPNAPEVTQAESDRARQRLEDNKSLIIALADAIAQNKPELARAIAIILAPRLNYSDPKKLIAELKEGTINIGGANNSEIMVQVTPTSDPSINKNETIIELK